MPDPPKTPESIFQSLGQFDLRTLSPMQAALRQLLIGFGVAIALPTVCVLIVRWRETPPRPALNAGAEVQAVYREQREEANEDAQNDFERVGGGFLVPTFTALLGDAVGVKTERKDAD